MSPMSASLIVTPARVTVRLTYCTVLTSPSYNRKYQKQQSNIHYRKISTLGCLSEINH